MQCAGPPVARASVIRLTTCPSSNSHIPEHSTAVSQPGTQFPAAAASQSASPSEYTAHMAGRGPSGLLCCLADELLVHCASLL